jgi:type II secretion system protein I
MPRDSKGFTLVEALLALAILATAVAGMLTVRANAVRNVQRAHNERLATLIAGQLLADVALDPPQRDTAEQNVDGHPGFSYRYTLATLTVEPLGKVEKLRIEVLYPSADGERGQRDRLAVETLFPAAEKE